jgi:predicted enzyme related to lactoylglutathione lyase
MFGWHAGDPDPKFGGYFQYFLDGAPVAGSAPAMPDAPETPTEWTVYLAVGDARATLEATIAQGGEIVLPAMDVGDLGTMAITVDPGGAKIGVWEPKAFAGLGILGEAGAPSWFELATGTYESVVAYYRHVFGWTTEVMSDTAELRYTVMGGDDGPLAGVMDAGAFLPDGAPSTWSVYFWVDDTDVACTRVVELGGAIIRPAQDTPYGRLASATDPQGAHFNLMAANEAMPARR